MPYLKKLLLLCFSLFTILSTAQSTDTLIQKEINREVWKPFCESYSSQDAETFNALHTDDVIRVTPWNIRVGNEYKNQISARFKANKEKGDQRTIELWFEHRKTTPELSYEVGYYNVTYQKNGKEMNSYGRFHVLLKKENGKWKIAQDWDTDKINGVEVTEKDWLKGTPLVF